MNSIERAEREAKIREDAINLVAGCVAAGLAVNAQVCMRQWNPEFIAYKAREIATAIVDKVKPDAE
jgi:hypothetical protein